MGAGSQGGGGGGPFTMGRPGQQQQPAARPPTGAPQMGQSGQRPQPMGFGQRLQAGWQQQPQQPQQRPQQPMGGYGGMNPGQHLGQALYGQGMQALGQMRPDLAGKLQGVPGVPQQPQGGNLSPMQQYGAGMGDMASRYAQFGGPPGGQGGGLGQPSSVNMTTQQDMTGAPSGPAVRPSAALGSFGNPLSRLRGS
jgi:hypothetical protein